MITLEKPKSYKKAEALEIWKDLQPAARIEAAPIAYRHEGTTIAEDGIRICGSERFIKSVLSRLKDLLSAENGETRLSIAWGEVVDKETGCIITGSFRCSVQVHDRGPEAKILSMYTNRR